MILLDRLEADLELAALALKGQELFKAHESLMRAQTAVALLRDSLREDLWEGAANLKVIYSYALERLVKANVYKDPQALEEARIVLCQIIATWREAARAAEVKGEIGARVG
jgi:flagellar protein FliS